MIAEHNWIGFSAVSASTEAQGTSISELECSEKPSVRSWECGRFASFPQEVILRLDHRVQFSYILVASKPHKLIPELEVYIGDGIYGSFLDAEYHFGGKSYNITPLSTQVPVTGIGSYVKLCFTKRPTENPHNPHGQVSLAQVKIWGRKIDYMMDVNTFKPTRSHNDEVDKILLGMGVPLEMIMWSYEDMDSFRYAPVDTESRETLLELSEIKDKAYVKEDFANLKQITIDIKRVFDMGTELLALKRELLVAVAKEDYDQAMVLKTRIKKLESERDMIDAKYETRRYYKMMEIGEPSDSYLSMVDKMMREEKERNEMLRLLQLEEAERHRRYLEELERKRRLDEMANNRNNAPSPIRRKEKVKKKVEEKEALDDPFVYNEGDVDLEPYFRSKFNEAGGQLKFAAMDIMKRADGKKILRVVGARLWSCLFSDNWRHREAAVRAFLEFLEAPLLQKYEKDTRALFRAAVDISLIACEDRVMPIYLYGLKIMITAMSHPICDLRVTVKMINDAMRLFIPILLDKISELNYRARDLSMNTLIELFRHPKIHIGPLVEHIMGLANPASGPLDKQPWRILLSRLEILIHVIQEFGVDPSQWAWKEVLEQLILPLFSHGNQDVRKNCMEICIALYQKVGMEVRAALEGFGRLVKPMLAQTMYKRMLDLDQNKGMAPIHETQEWTEHSPPGSAKGGHKMSQLKNQLSELAVEESRKV